MAITVAVAGAHPLAIAGILLEGYHRPLNGEVANLTVTIAHADLYASWLQAPPLGAACAVSDDDELLLSGVLYGVDVTASAVRLRVEG